MQLPDINVLIYAHRDDAPEHELYAQWLTDLATGQEPFGIAEIVLAGFLRIVTTRQIFNPPTPMADAIAFCNEILAAPRAVLITPGARHWSIFTALCPTIQGPLVTDAYLAALAIEHGCELITTDSDFSRFAALRSRHPLRS